MRRPNILWKTPTHHNARTVCFGMLGNTLVQLSGPRHIRGDWTIRFVLAWPLGRPYGAIAQFDHTESIATALIEDARSRAAEIIDDVVERCAEAARRRRDAQTIQRMSTRPARAPRSDDSATARYER
jgi:hypothetical protein